MPRRSSRRLTNQSALTDMTSVSREPLRRAKKAARAAAGVSNENEGPESIQIGSHKTTEAPEPGSAGHATTLLNDLGEEIESRCDLLRVQGDNLSRQIRNALQVELMKLPRRIRTMKMSEFVGSYGGDVSRVLLESVRNLSKTLKTPGTVRASKKTKSVFPGDDDEDNEGGASGARNVGAEFDRAKDEEKKEASSAGRDRPSTGFAGFASTFGNGKKPGVSRTFGSRRGTQIGVGAREGAPEHRQSIFTAGNPRFSAIAASKRPSIFGGSKGKTGPQQQRGSSSRFGAFAGPSENAPATPASERFGRHFGGSETPAFDPRLPRTPAAAADPAKLSLGIRLGSKKCGGKMGARKAQGAAFGKKGKRVSGSGSGVSDEDGGTENAIIVETGAGGEVDLSSPTQQAEIKKSAEARELAVAKLQALQSQVSALVDQLMAD